jgi:hypothetical protein
MPKMIIDEGYINGEDEEHAKKELDEYLRGMKGFDYDSGINMIYYPNYMEPEKLKRILSNFLNRYSADLTSSGDFNSKDVLNIQKDLLSLFTTKFYNRINPLSYREKRKYKLRRKSKTKIYGNNKYSIIRLHDYEKEFGSYHKEKNIENELVTDHLIETLFDWSYKYAKENPYSRGAGDVFLLNMENYLMWDKYSFYYKKIK